MFAKGRIGNRMAVVGAAVAGFALGAAGFAAASHDSGGVGVEAQVEAQVDAERADDVNSSSSPSSSSSTAVSTTVDDDDTTSTPRRTSVIVAAAAPTTSVGRSLSVDASSTSVANTIDDDDDSTSTSVANTAVSNTAVSNTAVSNTAVSNTAVSNTVDDHGGHGEDHDDDDSTSTSVANTIDDDNGSTSTSVVTTNAPSAPAPFTQTYSSAGGSITVTWNGSSLSLDAINANAGFVGEIEDGGGSRVRVDFESNSGSGGDDARIEVRVEGGQIEVRVD